MLKTSTIADQVTAHLRDGLQRRHWADHMPGRSKLADELGVNVKTVERALVKLEREGLLESRGAGRRRRIVASKQQGQPATQVKMILYERDESYNPYVLEIRRALLKVGHSQPGASQDCHADAGGTPETRPRIRRETIFG